MFSGSTPLNQLSSAGLKPHLQKKTDGDGFWFTQLNGHAVRAHIADIRHQTDIELDDHLVLSPSVEVPKPDEVSTIIALTSIEAEQTVNDARVLTFAQD